MSTDKEINMQPMPRNCVFVKLSEKEMQYLEKQAADWDMSRTAVLKHALRLLQLVNARREEGHTLLFGKDGVQKEVIFIV